MTLPGPRISMTFKRNTGSVSDGMGGILPSWTKLFITTGIVGTLRGSEQTLAMQDGTVAELKFFVDYDKSTTGRLTERDEVEIDETTYKILYIRNPGLLGSHLEILVERVSQ